MNSFAQPLPSDPRRQAVHTLRAYDYQIWSSIKAWLELGADDVLYLEGNEDFDQVSPERSHTVQVKTGRDPLTLNTAEAKGALENFLSVREHAPKRDIRFFYLTTARIGHERGVDFGGMPGIDAWVAGRRDAVIAEQIRAHLLKSFDNATRLGRFLASASTLEIQTELLERFFWLVEQPTTDALETHVMQQIRVALLPEHYADSIVQKAKDALYSECWRQIKRLELKARALTAASAKEVLARATTVDLTVSVGGAELLGAVLQLSTLQGASNALALLWSSVPALPAVLLARDALVGNVLSRVRAREAVLLTGPVFHGKSTVAQIVASQFDGEARWVKLSEQTGAQTAHLFTLVQYAVEQPGRAGLLIFDDLDTSPPARRLYADAMRLLLHAAKQSDVALVFTAQGHSDTLAHEVQAEWDVDLLPVPSLDMAEVKGHCIAYGCPESAAESFANLVWMQSAGQPRLVQVRVKELADRGWVLHADDVFAKSPAATSAKARAREYLASAYPAAEAEFVLQAGEFITSPTREALLRFAESLGNIHSPGSLVDNLTGRWLEAMPGNRYRVTPIVRGALNETWTPEAYRVVHARLFDALVAGRKGTPGDAAAMVSHGVLSEDGRRLFLILSSVLSANADIAANIDEYLGWFLLVPAEAPFIEAGGPAAVSHVLMLQFRLAGRKGDGPSLASIGRRWFAQVERMPEPLSGLMGILAAGAVVSQVDLTDFALVLEAALRFRRPVPHATEVLHGLVQGLHQESGPWGPAPDDLTAFQAMLGLRSGGVQSPQDFSALLAWIEAADDEAALKEFDEILKWRTVREAGGFVHSGWVAEANKDIPDWTTWVRLLTRATYLCQRRGLVRFGATVVVALSIIQQDYLNDSAAALATVSDGRDAFGDSVVLRQQLLTLAFANGHYETGYEIWGELVNDLGFDEVDVLAYRKAAICAAHLGKLEDAQRLFEDGARAFKDRNPMGHSHYTGLLVDASYCAWRLGNLRETTALLKEVAEELPSVSGDEEPYGEWQRAIQAANAILCLALGDRTAAILTGMYFGKASDTGTVTNAKVSIAASIEMFRAGVTSLMALTGEPAAELVRVGLENSPSTSLYVRHAWTKAALIHQLVFGADESFASVVYENARALESLYRANSAAASIIEYLWQDTSFLAVFALAALSTDAPEERVAQWRDVVSGAGQAGLASGLDDLSVGIGLAPEVATAAFQDSSRVWHQLGAAAAVLRRGAKDARITTLATGLIASTMRAGGLNAFLFPALGSTTAKRFAMLLEPSLDFPAQFVSPRVTLPALETTIAAALGGAGSLQTLLVAAGSATNLNLTPFLEKLP